VQSKGAVYRVIMSLIKEYIPPSAADLSARKDELGLTGNAMADLAGVASNS